MIPREYITFEKATYKRDRTGQKVSSWEPAIMDVPTERRKQQPKAGNMMNAKEEFIELQLVFWIRYLDDVTDDMRIMYNGKPYKIIDLKRQYWDNSLLITCTKINV